MAAFERGGERSSKRLNHDGTVRVAPDALESISTHFEDLQSEVEAGSRTIEQIRGSVLEEHFKQADAMGALVRRIEELRSSVRQQREMMRVLRHEIRALRQRATVARSPLRRPSF